MEGLGQASVSVFFFKKKAVFFVLINFPEMLKACKSGQSYNSFHDIQNVSSLHQATVFFI